MVYPVDTKTKCIECKVEIGFLKINCLKLQFKFVIYPVDTKAKCIERKVEISSLPIDG